MELAAGVSLHQRWPAMDLSERLHCIGNIFLTPKDLANLEFSAYGSLYFAESPFLSGLKLAEDPEFCVGPHCGTMFWDCNPGQPRWYHDIEPNQGPWQDFTEYYSGLIDSGLARLPPPGTVVTRPRYQGSIEQHKELLTYAHTTLKELAKTSPVLATSTPTLFHPDLHKRNIFVSASDPTSITAIIDWQSTSIEPAFKYTNTTPDFAVLIPDPSNEAEFEQESELCAEAYDVCLRAFAPTISAARHTDDSYFRPFWYCHRTWKDGAAAFREELIQTRRLWGELGYLGECPFPGLGEEELERHKGEYKLFGAAQQLRGILSRMLGAQTDGWVEAGQWEGVQAAHCVAFETLVRQILEEEEHDDDEPLRTEEDVREIWPIDLNGEGCR